MSLYKKRFLTEGAKHMYHPYDLPEVKNGNDLLEIFKKTVYFLQGKNAPLKIDGINVNPRLVTNEDGNKEFALYSGSIADAETSITKKRLRTRFEKNIGRAEKGEVILDIFNESIKTSEPLLKKLGLWDDPNIVLFSDYVSTGKTNVVQYDKQYIAIHLLMKIVKKPQSKAYTLDEVEYNNNALLEYIKILNTISSKYNIEVFHQKVADLTGTPDFNRVLQQPFKINKETKPLGVWLQQANQPIGKKIVTKSYIDPRTGVNKPSKTIEGNNQALYLDFLNYNNDLTALVEPQSMDTATDDIIFWHADRLLGKAILDVMNSELGSAATQEGVVINDKNISSYMFKITGDFFIRNSTGGAFRKIPTAAPAKKEESDENQLNADNDIMSSPYKRSPYLHPPYFGMGEGQRLTSKPSTFQEMVDMVVGKERGNQRKVIVVYPGRFQPFHIGHAQVYNKLRQEFPQASVFIATSDKTDNEKSPFNFEEKQQLILSSGIDPTMVVKVANPYVANEIIQKYSKDNTILIFAIGQKDMSGPDARFKFGVKKDGSPSYFQKFESLDKCDTLSEHGYIMAAPTVNFKIGGDNVQGATQIRQKYKAGNDAQRKQIITDLYGKFIPNVYELFNQKLT